MKQADVLVKENGIRIAPLRPRADQLIIRFDPYGLEGDDIVLRLRKFERECIHSLVEMHREMPETPE